MGSCPFGGVECQHHETWRPLYSLALLFPALLSLHSIFCPFLNTPPQWHHHLSLGVSVDPSGSGAGQPGPLLMEVTSAAHHCQHLGNATKTICNLQLCIAWHVCTLQEAFDNKAKGVNILLVRVTLCLLPEHTKV